MSKEHYSSIVTPEVLALLENLKTSKQEDKTSAILEAAFNFLIQVGFEQYLGAAKYERSNDRIQDDKQQLVYRNGARHKTYTTANGDLDLLIPKARSGKSYFPEVLLNPRKRIDKALYSAISESYISGVSTRKVEKIISSLGSDAGISKSKVSQINEDLDESISAFLKQKIEGVHPYLYLDATFIKSRNDNHVQSMAAVVAISVDSEGKRHILGFDVGNSETYEFWSEFISSLTERGLKGVKLVITDAHQGLQNAIKEKLQGCAWQRCKVHFMRNIRNKIPKRKQDKLMPYVKDIFRCKTKEGTLSAYNNTLAILEEKCPEAARLLEEAKEDILAYIEFPPSHWKKISNTNLIERFNRELKRRSDVVQIFPNKKSVLRLLGSIMIDQDDEWQADERHYISKDLMDELYEEKFSLQV
jgi:transposase-like protein